MPARTPHGPLAHVRRLQRLVPDAHRGALVAVRLTLSMVYIWFGALKVAGVTPVAELVTATTPWPDPSWFMPALGGIEVSIGVWLLAGRGLLVALPLFTGHMLGTLAALALLPQVMFQDGNPLLLTTLGEFVLKNMVLLAAGIAAMTSAHNAKNSTTKRAANPVGTAESVTDGRCTETATPPRLPMATRAAAYPRGARP